jgi:uncharacterized phage infection (PIP) family protein YhgE
MRTTKILAGGVAAISLMVATPALAQSTTTSANRRAAAQTAAMDTIKGRAKQAIDTRLTTLSNLTTLVAGAKHVSSANRSALTQQLADEKSGLTALEAKIQADSDMQTLIDDARSIVNAYRVYLLVEPKVREVLAADRMLAVVDAFDTVFGRVDNKVTADSDKALLADAKAKVADAQAKARAVPGAVLDLQPAGYPGNRPALQSARASLRTGRQDLVTARQDVAKLVHS